MKTTYWLIRDEVPIKHILSKAPLFTTSVIGTNSEKALTMDKNSYFLYIYKLLSSS